MEFFSTSQATSNFLKIINHVATTHELTYVGYKQNKVVLIAKEYYRSLMETLHIASIPGLKESILEASKKPLGC